MGRKNDAVQPVALLQTGMALLLNFFVDFSEGMNAATTRKVEKTRSL